MIRFEAVLGSAALAAIAFALPGATNSNARLAERDTCPPTDLTTISVAPAQGSRPVVTMQFCTAVVSQGAQAWHLFAASTPNTHFYWVGPGTADGFSTNTFQIVGADHYGTQFWYKLDLLYRETSIFKVQVYDFYFGIGPYRTLAYWVQIGTVVRDHYSGPITKLG